jgi:hypothetical protein
LADGVFTDLFFEDRSGRPRIASYEGQCSLARWLRIVISNRTINERQRKCNDVDSLESAPDFIDENSLQKIELLLRANQYRPIVQAERVVMLNPIACEHFDASIVYRHGEVNDNFVRRLFQDPSDVRVKLHSVGGFAELFDDVVI